MLRFPLLFPRKNLNLIFYKFAVASELYRRLPELLIFSEIEENALLPMDSRRSTTFYDIA